MMTRTKNFVAVPKNGASARCGNIPVTVVRSDLTTPALLLASHAAYPLPSGTRKIVNPVTVNALTNALRQKHPPVVPLGPPFPYDQCCSCCYCYCEISEAKSAIGRGQRRHSSGETSCRLSCITADSRSNCPGGRLSVSCPGDRHCVSAACKNDKIRRRRSRSRDTVTSDQCGNGADLRTFVPKQSSEIGSATPKPRFVPITRLEDAQAIRCAEFNPKGTVYAVGANSKVLRICAYPDVTRVSQDQVAKAPTVLYKRNKHHRGSIYCLGWSPDGSLLATGSNDKTVKLTRYDDMSRPNEPLTQCSEVELSMHDGTVRDLCFIEDLSNKSSLLVSGGAGDCKIYVTDCVTSTPFQALSGHSAPVSSLYTWGGVMFCSGSQDRSLRLWDLRTRGCVNVINPLTNPASATAKSPVGSVCVDPTGRLLISGHEDSAIVLFDIRGNRQVQATKAHSSDVRSVRFSPNAYYLLSAGYDQRIMLTDMQGDLSQPLTSVTVGHHDDKVISARWHPKEFTFLSASADKTSLLWALPPS